jgi:hypothetical protein
MRARGEGRMAKENEVAEQGNRVWRLGTLAALVAVVVLVALPFRLGGAPGDHELALAMNGKAGSLNERGVPVPLASIGLPTGATGRGGFSGVRVLSTLPLAGPVPPGQARVADRASALGPSSAGSVDSAHLAAQASTSPTVLGKFRDAVYTGWIPADPQLAANKTNILEAVNEEIRVTTLRGSLVYGPVTMQTFFGTSSTDNVGDVQAVYDDFGHRFIFTALDFTTNQAHMAISTTDSAKAAYYLYFFGMARGGSTNVMDQPVLGLNSQEIGVSTNQYTPTLSGSFDGSMSIVFNRVEMESGTYSAQIVISSADMAPHPARAVTTNGTGTATLYWATTSVASGAGLLTVFETTGLPPSVAVTAFAVAIANTGTVPGAVQPGTASLLNPGDDRVLSASWALTGGSGELWVSYTTACTPFGDATVRSCIRVDAVRTNANVLDQDTDTGVAGSYLFYGTLTALPGARAQYLMIVGFSGAMGFPSLAITGQAASDNFRTYRGPIPAFYGAAYDTSGRWGDYFGAQYNYYSGTTTPSAWGVGMYDSSTSVWATEVMQFRF